MRWISAIMAVLTLAALVAGMQPPPPAPAAPAPAAKPDHSEAGGARFEAVDVYVDSGGKPLGAYQIELKAASGDVKAVGIEGGEAAAFGQAPYYDPAALHDNQLRERIVL